MKKLLYSLVISMVFVSCSGQSVGLGVGLNWIPGVNIGLKTKLDPKAQELNLFDSDWSLKEYKVNGEFQNVVSGSQITLDFKEDGKMYGNTGINGFFGDFKLDGNQFESIGPFGMTRMAGAQDLMNQESKVLEVLGKINNYEIKNNILYLMSYNEVMLTFEPIK